MKVFRLLERRLKLCQLNDRKKRLLRSVLGLNGIQQSTLRSCAETAWPEIERLSKNERKKVLNAAGWMVRDAFRIVKKAIQLPRHEFDILCKMDHFYQELFSLVPDLSAEKLEKSIFRFSGGRANRIGSSRYSLNLGQIRIADILLGLNGEIFDGGAFELTRKLYPEIRLSKEIKVLWYGKIRYYQRGIYEKISKVWELNDMDFQLLTESDPWYPKLLRKFPDRNEDTLKKIHDKLLVLKINKRACGVSVRNLTDKRFLKLKKEKKFFLKLHHSSMWSLLDSTTQKVIETFYGFDLSNDQVRGLSETSRSINLDIGFVSGTIKKVKKWFANSDLSLLDPFDENNLLPVQIKERKTSKNKWEEFLAESYLNRMRSDKKIFLDLREKEYWNSLDQRTREVISFCYGLDLPDGEVRGVSKTAKEFSNGLSSISAVKVYKSITKAKFHFVRIDPSLPFRARDVDLGVPRKIRTRKIRQDEKRDSDFPVFDSYYRDIMQYPEMSDDDIKQINANSDGNNLNGKERLFRLGLRDIIPIAFAWHRKEVIEYTSFDVLDLIQEGNIGLWLNINYFDGESRKDLKDFVSETARDSIKLALRKAGMPISLNKEFSALVRKIGRGWWKLYRKLKREPEVEELVLLLKIPTEDVENTLKLMRTAIPSKLSLDQELRDGDDRTLHDIFGDKSSPAPDEILISIDDDDYIQRLLSSLDGFWKKIITPVEQFVLTSFLGLNQDPISLNEIATHLNIKEKEVIEIKSGALLRLRENLRLIAEPEKSKSQCGKI